MCVTITERPLYNRPSLECKLWRRVPLLMATTSCSKGGWKLKLKRQLLSARAANLKFPYRVKCLGIAISRCHPISPSSTFNYSMIFYLAGFASFKITLQGSASGEEECKMGEKWEAARCASSLDEKLPINRNFNRLTTWKLVVFNQLAKTQFLGEKM